MKPSSSSSSSSSSDNEQKDKPTIEKPTLVKKPSIEKPGLVKRMRSSSESEKGPYLNDVHNVFVYLDPLSPLVHI